MPVQIRARTPARFVLVDALDLAWQRAKYCGHRHPVHGEIQKMLSKSAIRHAHLWCENNHAAHPACSRSS
jgi:hypothetical protein